MGLQVLRSQEGHVSSSFNMLLINYSFGKIKNYGIIEMGAVVFRMLEDNALVES